MTDARMCSACTLTTADIGVDIDGSGVCSVCRFEGTHGKATSVGWEELEKLTLHKKGSGDYDCLVCWSGGKDSTFVVDYLVRVKGWRVATFTFDNSFIAPGAFHNIDRITERLKLKHFTVRADADEYRTSLRVALEGFSSLPPESIYYKTIKDYGPVCYLCGAIFHSVAVKLALELGCKMIATGFTVGQDPLYYADYKTQDAKGFADKVAKARQPTLHTVDHWYGVGQLLRRYLGDAHSSARDFFLTKEEHEKARDVAMFRLFDFIKYDPSTVVETIKQIGWETPAGVDSCSTNCMVNSLGIEWYQAAFGCHLYAPEMAEYVRDGKMTKSDALAVLGTRPDPALVRSLIKKIGLTEESFAATTHSFSKPGETSS